MNRDGHQQKSFFIGPEVEHTPAFSKKTLFVAGIHPEEDADTIERLAREHKTPHIFLGANHSFDATHYTEYFAKTWEDLVTRLLDRGFWVTLDYPAHQHETVLKMFSPGIWQSRQFVPLLSVRIPKIQTSSPNLTVKIDDIDFNATNPGVWCMHFHEVTDSNRFTDWQDYGTDMVLDVPENIVPEYKVVKEPTRVVTHIEVPVEPTEENLRVIESAFNDTSLGLDPDGKSRLKEDPDAPQETTNNYNRSPAEAAEAYASGAKEDPLGKTAPKKTTVKTKK